MERCSRNTIIIIIIIMIIIIIIIMLIRGRTHFWETAYSKRTTWKKLRKQPSR